MLNLSVGAEHLNVSIYGKVLVAVKHLVQNSEGQISKDNTSPHFCL